MSYPTVPFQESWIASENVDAKGVYRRPHRNAITNDVVTDALGVVAYDYSILPVRRHNDWLGKGFEWVTIADAESLGMVANSLRAQGLNPRDFIMDPRTNSPWNPAKYAANATQTAQTEHARLKALVEKHGVEATEEILGRPLPESLRSLAPKAKAAKAVPA